MGRDKGRGWDKGRVRGRDKLHASRSVLNNHRPLHEQPIRLRQEVAAAGASQEDPLVPVVHPVVHVVVGAAVAVVEVAVAADGRQPRLPPWMVSLQPNELEPQRTT